MINSESFGFLYAKNIERQTKEFVSADKKNTTGVDFCGKLNFRFNFIVSTKNTKKAFLRNLIRRRLSEITREIFIKSEKCDFLKSVNGVFLCKKAILNKTYQELRDEVLKLIDKI